MTPNERAFLAVIAHSEGCDGYGVDKDGIDNGYRVIVGSTHVNPDLMQSFTDHPRKYVYIPAYHIESSASGRYQILARYYDVYKKQLNLPDFGPASQDAIALKMIDECHARDDINRGLFAEAVNKCKSRWASFPGSDYGQHTNKMEALQLAFIEAGGSLAGC